jgi:hypothetical protein
MLWTVGLFITAALLCAVAGPARGQGNAVDVSAYPADMQRAYKVFATRCSRCHAIGKPLAASYTTDQEWQDVIRRMARMQGASIAPSEQDDCRKFLVFHMKVRSGQQKLSAAPAANAAEPRPAAGAGPEPVAQTRDGVRIEVLAREPQSLRQPRDGNWVSEAPRGDETLYLVVRLLDDETREKIPYARVSARVLGGAENSARPLAPAVGPDGFHYGANLVAPPGRLRLSLTIEPPSLAQVGSTTLKLTRPMTVEVELERR